MKKIISVLLILAVFLLSCCFAFLDDISDSYKNVIEYDGSDDQPDDSEYEEISDLLELRDYVAEQIAKDHLEFSFIYSGEEELDPGVIAKMGGVCFVKYVQEGNLIQVTMTEFPGSRIVDAYFADDTSHLTEDEQLALDKALELLEAARRIAKNDWELELAIHDILAQHITYSDADIYYEEPEDQPRHLSVIGALLDGEANCQGYTDAFYTLASIAGFEVGRLSVEAPSAPHMVNTICLDGQWYVVDVTYDDSGDEMVSYHLFNAGLDMIGEEYEWSEEVGIYPIVPGSDENSYYIRNDVVFDDMDDLAEYVAEQWAYGGNNVIRVMLRGEYRAEKLNDILPEVLEEWRKSYEYRIWYSDNGSDSFYTVKFAK